MTRPITTEQPWAELERLAKAAKLGTWKVRRGANTHFFDYRIMSSVFTCVAFADQPNASFIAAANPDAVLELIAAARANSVGTDERSEGVDQAALQPLVGKGEP